MNIESFDLGLIKVAVIIPFLFLGFSVFLFSLYYIFYNKLKVNVIFDIGFILIIFGFFFSRLFGFIDDFGLYWDLGWGILPLEDNGSSIFINHKLPWEFLNIFDGNFYLIGFPIGMIIGAYILYLLSNKAQGINFFLDTLVMAIVPFHFVVLIGAFVSQFYYTSGSSAIFNTFISSEKDYRMSTALVELVVLIIAILLAYVLKLLVKKNGMIVASYLLSQGIVMIFFISNLAQVSNEMFFNITGATLIIGSLGIFILSIKDIFLKKKRDRAAVPTNQLINQPAYSDLEITQVSMTEKLRRLFKWRKK